VNPALNSVKEICNELGIPDSKVYPALKKLEEDDLIYRSSSQRPARYIAPEPQRFSEYLETATKKLYDDKLQLLKEIDKQVGNLWDPDEPSLGQIAYLFKGNAINGEIRRMFKHAKNKMMLLVAPSSLKYAETIEREVIKLIDKEVRVELAFPSQVEFLESFEKLQELDNNFLKVKESISEISTYIVRDGDTMLNITHRDRGDVALLTNDPLLVDYIDGCWNNTACCTVKSPYGEVKLDVLN
jgi:sugar-specific transcriptional regulator TrmB